MSFALTFSLSLVMTLVYCFGFNHSWYATKIGVSPFYEVTEHVGGYLEGFDTETNEPPIGLPFHLTGTLYKLEYDRILTRSSPRRPIRHEITIWQPNKENHEYLIQSWKVFVDSLVLFPHESFEERKILKAEILYLDSVLAQPQYVDSLQLKVKLRAKRKELENNYNVNYIYAQEASKVSSLEQGKLVSFWLLPFLVWWSFVRYKMSAVK